MKQCEFGRVSSARRLAAQVVWLGIAYLAMAPSARADVCFPTPIAVPGLSGPPVWVGAGTVRTELDEPRWGAAPLTGFATDPTDLEASYRILVDSAFTQLSVSIQALAEPNLPTNADAVYFGFSTSATTAQAIRIDLPTGAAAGMPIAATTGMRFTYAAGVWTPAPGIAGSPWLVDESGWSNAPAGADWAVNFKVDLVQAGITTTNPFKIFLGIHMADEVGVNTIDLSTPDPGVTPVHAGTLFPEDPNNWAPALAPNAGCPDGVQIFGYNLGTRNMKMGMPAPNSLNTTLGATNRFFAQPTYPGSLLVFPGMLQARFRIANWGSIASPAAAWTTIINGAAVQNGIAPSPDVGTIEFDCPTNIAGQACGAPIPAVDHQCMMVELMETPGNTVPITRAAAYTNMRFEPLSVLEDTAEISIKGLAALTGVAKDRDVYLYVHPKNLPAHGDKALYLPNAQMQRTRAEFYAPPPRPKVGERPNDRPVDPIKGAQPKGVQKKKGAPGKDAAVPPGAVVPPVAPPPGAVPGAGQPAGNGESSMAPFQKLAQVWPTYDVHVYYDTGAIVADGAVTYRRLQPMYPFTYFLSHDGPLFGFNHGLEGTAGVLLEQLRPNVYRVRVPNEGSVKIQATISAEETPKNAPETCADCPKPGVPPVEKDGHCNCELVGTNSGRHGLLWLSLMLGSAWLARRRSAPRA